MPHHRLCWFFGLLSVFEVLSLGTGNISKYGCIGDSIELYSNISFNVNFTVVSVYKNGVNNNLIAAWSVHNFAINSTFINGYADKLSLDKKGSIWIYRLHISDEAKYSITIDKGNGPSDDVVQLGVLVAPTTNCIPKIKRVKDVLTVFIDHNVCGRPVATVYWLNHSGIEHTETNVIELQPGKRVGTYYACIKGDALKCAKVSRFSDHCSFLNIEEGQPSQGTEGSATVKDTTIREKPSTDQEGVGTFKDNTVQDINRSEINTNTAILPITVSTLVIMIIFVLVLPVMCIKKIRNPGGWCHGESAHIANDSQSVTPPGNGGTADREENQQSVNPPGNSENDPLLPVPPGMNPLTRCGTATPQSNQPVGGPPGNGETATPQSNQPVGDPPGNGEPATPLSSKEVGHPPGNDESPKNNVGAEKEKPDVVPGFEPFFSTR